MYSELYQVHHLPICSFINGIFCTIMPEYLITIKPIINEQQF